MTNVQLADAVVTRLYRRFKEWNRRRFGPEDVTWCEVKADVLELIRLERDAAEPTAPPECRKSPDGRHSWTVFNLENDLECEYCDAEKVAENRTEKP